MLDKAAVLKTLAGHIGESIIVNHVLYGYCDY